MAESLQSMIVRTAGKHAGVWEIMLLSHACRLPLETNNSCHSHFASILNFGIHRPSVITTMTVNYYA